MGDEEKDPVAESSVVEPNKGVTLEKGEDITKDAEDGKNDEITVEHTMEEEKEPVAESCVVESSEGSTTPGKGEDISQDIKDGKIDHITVEHKEEEKKEPVAESCVVESNEGSTTPEKGEDIAQDTKDGENEKLTVEHKIEEEKEPVAESNASSTPEKDEKIAQDEDVEKDGSKNDEITEVHKMDIDGESFVTKDNGDEVLEGKEEDMKEEIEPKEEDSILEMEIKEGEVENDKKGDKDKDNEVDAMEEDIQTKAEEEESEEPKDEEEEEEEHTEEIKMKKGSRGRGKAKVDNKETVKEPKTPFPLISERPVRERKSVERLVTSIENDSNKEICIEKGQGTALKDIPNVAYRLTNRKDDDILKLLHSILFGRRGKAIHFKSNIFRFSGYVWKENEEKQKLKVKEKLDKCVKDKLLELCEVLDISVNKTTIKKEDIVIKLIDFLVAPHSMTTELLAEEQSSKGKKRKRAAKDSASVDTSSSKHSAKSGRKTESISKEGDKDEVNVNGIAEKVKDEVSKHSDSEEKSADETEDESEEDTTKHKQGFKKSSVKKGLNVNTKRKKISSITPKKSAPPAKKTKVELSSSSSKRSKANDNKDTSPNETSSKKKKVDLVYKKTSTLKKKVEETEEKSSTLKKKPASSTEKPGKKIVKGRSKAKEEKLPSDSDLKDAICEILKEVDFNTATFTDILKQLGGQFKKDLTLRKSTIKLMIQDELTKLADDDNDGSDDDDENDGNQPSGRGVKA